MDNKTHECFNTTSAYVYAYHHLYSNIQTKTGSHCNLYSVIGNWRITAFIPLGYDLTLLFECSNSCHICPKFSWACLHVDHTVLDVLRIDQTFPKYFSLKWYRYQKNNQLYSFLVNYNLYSRTTGEHLKYFKSTTLQLWLPQGYGGMAIVVCIFCTVYSLLPLWCE